MGDNFRDSRNINPSLAPRHYFRNLFVACTALAALGVAPVLFAQQLPTTKPAYQSSSAPAEDFVPEPSTPKAPQVTFQDDELTINAENSRLSDVLASVRLCTGADLDIPVGASNERVWVRLGPGPARKVISTLLSNTNLDYVIQASDTDPDQVRSILLTPKTKNGSAPLGDHSASPFSTASRIPKANQPAQDFSNVEIPAVQPVASASAAPTGSSTPSATPDASSNSPGTEIATASPVSTAAAASSASDAPRPTPSNTEQMIQTLENMYEQRKQMQSQTGSKPPGIN
ncbi:MAG: hypothetical protein WCE52_03495 [Candidatus Acidiferrum sp.]